MIKKIGNEKKILYILVIGIIIVIPVKIIINNNHEKSQKEKYGSLYDQYSTKDLEKKKYVNNYDNNNISLKEDLSYRTKSGYIGAFSKKDFDLGIKYLGNNDKNALNQLFNTGRTFYIKPGMKVFLVKSGIGTVIVRPDGNVSEIWVSSEAIEKN